MNEEQERRLIAWCDILDQAINNHDMNAVPGIFVAMALDGLGHEAETLRRKLVDLLREMES